MAKDLREESYQPPFGSMPDSTYDALGYPPQSDNAYQEHLAVLDKLLLGQKEEIDKMTAEDMKNHQLPLARVKKIMKSDEDVRMISAEAPALFAKACEMFIIELTHRSWLFTEENRRKTLQRSDIATAISRTDIFDFLIDIVPRENK